MKQNLVASINLINESVKNDVKCFVFTSSILLFMVQNQVLRGSDSQPEDPTAFLGML